MNIYEINDFSFAYPDEKSKALNDINLEVKKGEFLLLCGESGCGKTTFLRCLKSAVSPKGLKSGSILFNGENIENVKPIKQAELIGFVMQNPDSQTVTDKVWHEMAFGLESIGMQSGEIRLRVAEMSAFFGIEDWFHKDIDELSGGQKQILNLASVMAMNPQVIIFDEPTAQLDPVAADTFLNTVKKINTELGVTVIMAEHGTEEVFAMADRAVFMDGGSIYGEIDPKNPAGFTGKMYPFMPSAARIWFSVKNKLKCPVTVGEGKNWLYEYSLTDTVKKTLPDDDTTDMTGENAVEVKNIYFRYEKALPDVIKNMSLTVKKGEWLAVMGGNGAGKSTLLSLISAVNIPYSGKITVFGKNVNDYGNDLYNGVLGSVPQNPQTLFIKNKVTEELDGDKNEVEKIIDLCRLRHLLERHPYDISGGEQQRLAMAKVLLKKPKILLLDEPTKGLDRGFKAVLADILKSLIKDGITVITVSHDIEFCAEYADRCALVFDGTVISEDTPRRFFGGNTFYTTSANKISRGIIKNAVTEKDVIYACGGETSEVLTEKPAERPVFEYVFNEKGENLRADNEHKNENRRKLCAAALTAVIIPLTIIFGLKLCGDRRYYIVSLAVIIEAMLPFFGMFEGRKPKAREIVILAVMCAIGTAGRVAFFMIPQFKPMAAVVIISGAAFGAERGFLVGAISMLVSNMVFGQGPWTPWQMFAMGALGFLAGIIFNGSKRNRYALTVYGFLSVFCLYGLIMNISSAVIFQPEVNLAAIVSYIVSGIPFDAVHAFSTAVFLLITAKPILEKLDRVRRKYGFG